jgi:hypothetical protein
MNTRHTGLVCILSLAVISSCTKQKGNRVLTPEFINCHKTANPDSASISSRLPGTWKWKAISCFWSNKTTRADKNIYLTINPDGTFAIIENSSLIQQGRWNLALVDPPSWGIRSVPYSAYLDGRIFICGNQFVANNSYIDGCDYLFEK